jgi:hypothetical protein
VPRDNLDLFLGKGWDAISPLLAGTGRLRLGVGADEYMVLGDATLSHKWNPHFGGFVKGSAGWQWQTREPYWSVGTGVELTW